LTPAFGVHVRGLDVTLDQLIATGVVGLLILIPFFAFRALGEVVGERNLVRLFFAQRRRLPAQDIATAPTAMPSAPATSSARCIWRAGLDRFQFLHNRPERPSNGLIVGAQLLRTSDNGRHYFKYRNNSLMVGIVFGTFGLASRSPRLKVDHVFRHHYPRTSFSTRTLSRPRPSDLQRRRLNCHSVARPRVVSACRGSIRCHDPEAINVIVITE
jgi:hypothetical protein